MLQNQSGIMLLGVLITVAISAMLVMGVASLFRINIAGVRHIAAESEIESIRQTLRRTLHCADTLGDTTCTSPIWVNIPLRRVAEGGSVEIAPAAPVTRVQRQGPWTLRGQCRTNAGIRELSVDYGLFDEIGTPLLDLMTQQAYAFRPLFGQGSVPCRDFLPGELLCTQLGGAWDDVALSCAFMSTNLGNMMGSGIILYDYTTPVGSGTPILAQSNVILCDIAGSHAGKSLKSCDRTKPEGDKKTCYYSGSLWVFKTQEGNIKPCTSGVYATTPPP